MPRLAAVVLLLLCPAVACREGDQGSTPSVEPLDLRGTWTVVGHHAPGVAAMTEAEAALRQGRSVRLGPARALSAGTQCDAPQYAARLVPRDSFLTAELKLRPGALARAGLPEQVTVLQVSCADVPWGTLGGRLIGIGPDRALAPWDGIFFELARDSDFRAVGQEPGWLLEIRQGREIRFIADYGADTAITPVPPLQTDTATGARTYHAATEARDLRVLIEPTDCTDAMSGQPYETTVTVTLDSRPYHGCGGPPP